MPSFVNRGVKMFCKGDCQALGRRRSEGRMKRYDSSDDLRAWCDNQEERRRYMLELMANSSSGEGGGVGGKYVPFETRIEILQMMRGGQNEGVNKKLEELEKELAAYRSLQLTDEQRQKLMGGVKNTARKESTTVLFKRKDDGHSSGAESDSENQDKLLADRDAQIQALKSQLDAKNKEDNARGNLDNSQLQAQLEKTKDELMSLQALYDQLKRKSTNCDDILAEHEALRMRVKDLEKQDDDLEKLRYRAKEADVLRMERDRLKERVDELATCETAYMKLLKETADYEKIAAERDLYKDKYEEQTGSNDDIEAMDNELKQLQGIEQERCYLLRELNELRGTIADQEDEIQRLLIMVEKLSGGNNNKEERLVKGLSSMNIQMDKQCERISELEAQLADLPALEEEIHKLRNQLKNTIMTQDKDRQLTCESAKMCKELDEKGKMLERARHEVSEYAEQLAALQRENDLLRSQIEALQKQKIASLEAAETLAGQADNKEKELLSELENLKNKAAKSEEENIKLQALLKSNEPTGTELDWFGKTSKEDENERLKNELNGLQKKLNKLEQDNRDLHTAACKAYCKVPADSKREIEDLRKTVASLEAEIKRLNRDKEESGGMALSLMDGDGSSSDQLIAILNKILATGIESLSFEELSFLHECICAASGKKILSNPDLKLSTMSPERHGMDKKELCNRVQILEEELTRHDEETLNKVCCLEKCVMSERRLLEEMRQTLNHEPRQNVELGSQHTTIKERTVNFADNTRDTRRELEEERAKCRAFELKIKKLKVANSALQTLLDDSHLPETLGGNQVPTRQPAPRRKSDHRRHVTYMELPMQEQSPHPVYLTAAGMGGHPYPALCKVLGPGQLQCNVPLEHGEQCPSTCVAANSYTELQMLAQRETFMSACSARHAKKPRKGTK